MNLYIRINDIRKTLTTLGVPLEQLPPAYDAIITKIDNKWVKITPDDLGDLDKDYEKKQKCIRETSERLNGDKEAINELTELYKKNMFIQVDEKLGSKNGSLGYLIKGDKEKLKSFVKGFGDTKAAKEYQKCDKDFKVDPSMFDGNDSSSSSKNMKTRFELWIDRWSHKLTSVKVNIEDDEAKGEFVVNTQLDVAVSVKAPTSDIVTFAELKKDIEAAFQAQYQQYDDITTRAQSHATQTSSETAVSEPSVPTMPDTQAFEQLLSN